MKTKIIATILGGLGLLGIAGQASAAGGVFTFDPTNSSLFTATPSPTASPIQTVAPFNADFINGNSSELLHIDGTAATQQVTVNTGYVDLTAFVLNSSSISVLTTGLGANYGLYGIFSITATLTSGGLGQVGSTYTLNSLTFTMYADPTNNNTYTAANVAGAGTEASVGNTGTDIALGSGSLVVGTAGIDALGGAFINATTTFSLTAFGSTVFTAPVPFFNLSFNNFNNTSQGVAYNFTGPCTTSNCLVSINNANGGLDFARVPEPGTLALLGLGLLGFRAASSRSRFSFGKA